MHTHTYTHLYICTGIPVHIRMQICTYICMFIHTHTYTHICTHIQHVHMHTRRHAWNDIAAATARGADADAGSSTRLFRSSQSTTCSTFNAMASLHPLPETPIPLNPPSPLPSLSQNNSRTTTSTVLLFYTDATIECTVQKKFHATSQWPLAYL